MDERHFYNLRIFVRNRNPRESDADTWLILDWVNEPLP